MNNTETLDKNALLNHQGNCLDNYQTRKVDLIVGVSFCFVSEVLCVPAQASGLVLLSGLLVESVSNDPGKKVFVKILLQ